MANTYTQFHIHAIFGAQNRMSLIASQWQSELYKYISGIISNKNHKVLAINGTGDHIHVLFGMQPVQTLSELMQEIKSHSSKWINEKKLVKGRFSWQEGFGAFSYGKGQLPDVIKYIDEQEAHHEQRSFSQEYRAFLVKFGVDFKEVYLFHDVE